MRIEFVEMKETRTRFVCADRWEFKPRGRFAPLLRRIFGWAVSKGYFANCFDEACEVTRHVVKPDSVIEALFRQREEVARHIGREATTVLMGSEDYAQMMRCQEIARYVEFNGHARDRGGVIGLKIKIVPWMRGVLVMQ